MAAEQETVGRYKASVLRRGIKRGVGLTEDNGTGSWLAAGLGASAGAPTTDFGLGRRIQIH